MFSKLAANFAQRAAGSAAGSARRVAFQTRFSSGQAVANGSKGRKMPFQKPLNTQPVASTPATFTIRVRCAMYTSESMCLKTES
jgi:carbamoyl-phosphate synthase small subunit